MAATNPDTKGNKRSLLNLTPGGKTRVVRIEVTHLNGRRFDQTLPTSDILNIWNSSLKLVHIQTVRQANFLGPNKTFRVNYRLKDPHFLSDLVTNPDFTYEKKASNGEVLSYSGRVLDIEDIEEAKIGETVTVVIKRTNAELSEEQIESWLIRFGRIVSKPRY